MHSIRYIIIDEITFIDPNILKLIYKRLRKAFFSNSHIPFESQLIILFGDLAQLPPIKDRPMYFSNSYGGLLWCNFEIVAL